MPDDWNYFVFISLYYVNFGSPCERCCHKLQIRDWLINVVLIHGLIS